MSSGGLPLPGGRRMLHRIDNAWGRLRALCGAPVLCRGRMTAARHSHGARQSTDLLDSHTGCDPTHINHSSLRDVLHHLEGRPANILETGSSAWGTNSTCLWDAYVQQFGGRVWSVDIRRSAGRQLRDHVSPATMLITDDSVRFLSHFCRQQPQTQLALVYLDSWDLDPLCPLPAALHCVREYEAIRPLLYGGALLLVDDTPASDDWLTTDLRDAAIRYRGRHGMLPGKGMLLDLMLQRHPGVEKLHHRYQALYRFN